MFVRARRLHDCVVALALVTAILAVPLETYEALGDRLARHLPAITTSAAQSAAPDTAPSESGMALGGLVSPASASTVFPLAVSPDRRHLVDRDGRPFLIFGEAAWSLIAELTREDAELYLRDRKARGFNTLLVSLIEHRFASNAPANAYGEAPFLVPGDFATPNERYFEHADWALSRARALGFLVLLTPAYMGYAGGPDGWYQEMVANGSGKLRDYGRYVGHRYRSGKNILWVAGGDFNPPDKSLARALALGIAEADPNALQTAHGVAEMAAIDYWPDEPWLRVNNIYTYDSVAKIAKQQYAQKAQMPFFLIESGYENQPDLTARGLRTQAYSAALTATAGQVFGNHPIWHFDGPGVFPTSTTWKEALGSQGTRDMVRLRKLLAALPWWQLEPDLDGSLLIEGLGVGEDEAVAARAADGSLALVYVPTARRVRLRLDRLAGPHLTAAWYDPTSGRLEPVAGPPLTAQGARGFEIAKLNSAGASDWLLIVRSGGDDAQPRP